MVHFLYGKSGAACEVQRPKVTSIDLEEVTCSDCREIVRGRYSWSDERAQPFPEIQHMAGVDYWTALCGQRTIHWPSGDVL